MQKMVVLVSLTIVACGGALAESAAAPFTGSWELSTSFGGSGWLEITEQNGYLDGSLVWLWGSVAPLEAVYIDGDTLYAVRLNGIEHKDSSDNVVRKHQMPELFAVKVSGDSLTGTHILPASTGLSTMREPFTAKRSQPLPPAPDLSKAKFGKPIKLFNGEDLKGWKLINPNTKSGWSVAKGELINHISKEEQPGILFGNLRTEKEFEDFNLRLEVNVPPDGNSGVFLRGIYEVQVFDSYSLPLGTQGMGAIYTRIAPMVAAEKPAGEWQTLDMTLLDRHVTVKLNGKTIIDNQPVKGCTGGALWSDPLKPGPIYLQGDHTDIKYRNIVLTPIIK